MMTEALWASAVAVAAIAATSSAPVRTAMRRRPGAVGVMGGPYLSVVAGKGWVVTHGRRGVIALTHKVEETTESCQGAKPLIFFPRSRTGRPAPYPYFPAPLPPTLTRDLGSPIVD